MNEIKSVCDDTIETQRLADDQREAAIRVHWKECGGYGNVAQDEPALLRLLDFTRVALSCAQADLDMSQEAVLVQNGVVLAGTRKIVALEAEIAQLKAAPPSADALTTARAAIARIISPQRWSNLNAGEESGFLSEAERLLASAIEQAVAAERTRIGEIVEFEPTTSNDTVVDNTQEEFRENLLLRIGR